MLKRNGLRHAEYYNMVETQDRLFRESKDGKVFKDLISIIASEQNIKLAYRNLKTNKGSNTPGVDGITFENLKELPEESIVNRVKGKIFNYQPKAVRRVYIPKTNGKMRPLGIPTVLDRIVQQCVLQVMEPVCEAKFHRYSYGFRPNRNCKQAVAMCYKLAQVSGFHYVVDVDIKGFFDNVNHGKLLKQIWALGIQDKQLISLISKMLKAPIEENGIRTTPDRGTPQGGVLSPLLANIVLNEFDWWIDSQWANMIIKHPCKSDSYYRDGKLFRGYGYKKLRASKLKEVFSVRYADDFKLFCKTYDHAVRLKKATEMWLKERLQLETSEEKSKVTNLKAGYSEFLGIKFKVYPKGSKWRIKSHMTDKAIKTQKVILKQHLVNACKDYGDKRIQHLMIIRYNQAVVGVHDYYNMATMVNEDVHKLFPSLDKTMKTQLRKCCKLSKSKPPDLHGGMDMFVYEKYRKSKQVWYINGFVLAPVAYCRHRNPMCHRSSVNQYTPEGRAEIHKMLSKEAYSDTLFELSQSINPARSIEYCDNRLSRFVAAQGKCEITGKLLGAEEVHCHHWKPLALGGSDEYSNLRIVHVNTHKLIHAATKETIIKYLQLTGCGERSRLTKVNKWRTIAGLEPILLNELN
jgi:group II intron reverse transcriptase/maturase